MMKKYIITFILLIATISFAAGFGEFGNTIPSIESWQTIVSKFASGSCTGYLKSDGTCSTEAGSIAANVPIVTDDLTATGGNISNTDITVGAGKTLDVSDGTLILALNEQIVASNATLNSSQMFGGSINTFGQTNDTTITLLAIEKGMNFCVTIGTTVAKYLRIDPNGSDSIYDGTTTAGDGKYFGVTSAAVGQKICFEAFQTGASAYDWSVSYLGAFATE